MNGRTVCMWKSLNAASRIEYPWNIGQNVQNIDIIIIVYMGVPEQFFEEEKIRLHLPTEK